MAECSTANRATWMPEPPKTARPAASTTPTSNARLAASAAAVLLVAALALTSVGCEEEIALVTPTDHAFSLHGILNPKADTQFVFVFPVEGRLVPAPPRRLDGEFTATDLTTGEARTWSDSLVTNVHGEPGHVFWSAFTPAFGHSYQLEMRSSRGSASSTTVKIPPEVSLKTGAASSGAFVVQPLFLEGRAERLLRLETTFFARALQTAPDRLRPGNYFTVSKRVVYDGRQARTEDGWVIRIDFNEGFELVEDTVKLHVHPDMLAQFGIQLMTVRVDMIVVNDEWNPPGGVFDSLLMVQPEVMSNVENGFGFVGAGYRVHNTWKPRPEDVERAGFRRFR